MDILDKLKNREEIYYPIERNRNMDVRFTLYDAFLAKKRFERFAPLFMEAFEEIDGPCYYKSDLYKSKLGDELYLKLDSELKVAHSVKARGGFNEVMVKVEDVLKKNNMLDKFDELSLDDIRKIMAAYTIEVSSTGNLGLSIGLCAKAFGFKAKVHMSRDAKDWKKKLLREAGAEVLEYDHDYTYAVKMGRLSAEQNLMSYFVDDEMSEKLFLGYAASIFEVAEQVASSGLIPSDDEPLHVFLPCGVGGAPGGIAFALRSFFKDSIRIYFVEPTEYPCMLYSFVHGEAASVNDIGLGGKTIADGLACSAPSKLVFPMLDSLIDGFFTFNDESILRAKKDIEEIDEKVVEASSAAALLAYEKINRPKNSILWVTGSNVDK